MGRITAVRRLAQGRVGCRLGRDFIDDEAIFSYPSAGNPNGNTAMSEMIDRVARALKDQAGEDHALPSWAVMARAAIEAMREPTPNMIDAGAAACQAQADWPETAVENAWPDMVDAALN